MKQRRTQYLLLILVAAVWGGIAYRIFNQMDDKNEYSQKVKASVKKEATNDTTGNYKIPDHLQNPFVEEIGKELEMPENYSTAETDIQEYIEPPRISWPLLEYFGYITSKKQPESRQILIKIDNSEYMIKTGQEINGIKLLKVFKDSAVFSYKTEIKTFAKK